MNEKDQFSLRIEEITKTTSFCVKRWDVFLDDSALPTDPGRAIRTALLKASSKALKFEFSAVYSDDHSWLGAGMRGLSMRRISEISENPYAVDSDIYGVVAVVKSGNKGIVIPLVSDLDESSSQAALTMIEADILSHIDSGMIVEVLGNDEFDLSVVSGNWKTLGRLMDQSILLLEEALWLRKPGSWDLLRGAVSGLPCSQLPEMSDNDFASRYFRSMRFSGAEIDSAKLMLESITMKEYEFLTPKWMSWFEGMVESLNLIGPPKAFEGLSVLLSFAYEEVAEDDPLQWHPVSIHNMCVACGLDPVSASFIYELARQDPIEFHNLLPTSISRYRALGVSMIPDVELSRYRASIMGRRSEGYNRLAAGIMAEASA
jgi:hypothetical protein